MEKEKLVDMLRLMYKIRFFEERAIKIYKEKGIAGESLGALHTYVGEEAIAAGACINLKKDDYVVSTHRGHGHCIAKRGDIKRMLAEIMGRVTGYSCGRGGSMHLYADRLLGGLAIVGGHVPIATGAAFTIKYEKQKNMASFCFMGDGAVAQGAVHESLNLASLWNLPCIYVIENNKWGMGTATSRAICIEPIGENMARSYNMKSYTLDGLDFFSCYGGFKEILHEVITTNRPVLVEVITQRFRGHSISDPGLYRTKQELAHLMEAEDPINRFKSTLIENGFLTEDEYKNIDKEQKDLCIAAMKFADESLDPDPITLEEGVFAPEDSQ